MIIGTITFCHVDAADGTPEITERTLFSILRIWILGRPSHATPRHFSFPMRLLLAPAPLSPLLPSKSKHERFYSSNLTVIHHRFFFPPSQHRRCLSPPPTAAISSGNGDLDVFTQYSGYLFEGGTSEADSLEEYNVKAIADVYRRKPLLLVRRAVQIGTTVGSWFAARYVDGLLNRSDEMFKVRARELRFLLLKLGPAFVKIAQAVSSRPDVIPPAYLEELSLLQDRIAPFSTEIAFDTIEKELGLPLDDLFSEISPEPVAAASLGQVYQARLRSNGQVVAVKVQRPGVQAAISLDIFIMRFLAGILKRVGKLNTDLQAVVDEWATSLFREMDYISEAKNGLKFRKLYGGLRDVFVPEMYLEKTSRRVLIMEWVEGQKLLEVKDLYLIEVGVYCSLSQLLDYGFYHADPHPGNLMRTSNGKLAYLDFGMMGEFKQELRDGFVEACLHLVNRDFDALSKDFITLGLLPPTAIKSEVTKALTGVFRNAVNRGVRNISFGDLSGNLGRTMYKFKFQIPSYFSLVIRSLAVLEGIAIGFNPDYKVLSSSYPWIARKVLTDSSPQLRSTLKTLLYKEGVFRIDRLESLLSESLRARVEMSLLREQAVDDSNIAMKQMLTFVLTEKGSFVREILLQEFSKGIDALVLATLETVTSSATSRVLSVSSLSLSDEDIANLTTLRRLILLLSSLQNDKLETTDSTELVKRKGYAEDVAVVLSQATSFQRILPILSVIPELPPELQQELLLVPADLASKLVSRLAARTIKRVFL